MRQKIDNRRQLAHAMHALAMSTRDMAKALRLGPRGAKQVELWLSGARPIPGPAQVAVEAMLSERFGPVLDLPEHDPDHFDGEDHTPTRALYAAILDNAHKPDVVRSLADRWWAKDRDLLNALIKDTRRLSLEQYLALDNASP